MLVIAQAQGRTLSAVKSFTLTDFTPPPIPRARPRTWTDLSLFSRAFRIVKLGVIIWGIVSLAVIAAVGAYYLNGAREMLLVASAAPPIAEAPSPSPAAMLAAATQIAEAPAPPAAEPSASARERLAILMEQPSPLTMAPPSPELAQALTLIAATPAATPPAAATPAIAAAESRVPRPRPDEPIFTGSIKRTTSGPAPVADVRRRFGPCSALKSLGVPYLFGNRCGQYTRAYPPPAQPIKQAAVSPPPTREYAPKPYQPPAYVPD